MAIQDHELRGKPTFVAEVSDDGGGTLVSLAGELDLSNAPALREILVSPEVSGAGSVLVDLNEVSFLDSSIIGVIVSACKRKRSEGGDFSVKCGPGLARRALEVSGLVEYLEIEAYS